MSINIKENKSSIHSRYRKEIDGLRAFAVVAVIINHFNKDILPGGYLGVDIFFVISGFVITSSLYQRTCKNFRDFISGFYERRIKRLVPALSVFVIFMSLLICMFNPDPKESIKTGISSLFGLSNLYLLKQSTDYFATSTELNVFTHTWSLGVEEQFYFIFPFLIWFSGFGRQTKNGVRNFFLIVGLLTIASLIGFLYLYPINQSAAYFLMPTRFWEMAAGCLLFITLQKSKYIEHFFKKVPSILVLALIIVVMYMPMNWATTSTISVITLSSILIASLKKQTIAYKVFTDPKVVYIGLMSYSLYLWHWGILSISRWTIGIHWWSIPIQIMLIFVSAIISYRYVETPYRFNLVRILNRKIISFATIILIFLTSIIALISNIFQNKIYLGDPEKAKNLIVTKYKIEGTEIDWINCSSKEKKIEKCLFLEKNSNYHYFLVGDSHAGHLLPMLELIKKEIGGSFFTAISEGELFPYENNDWPMKRLQEGLIKSKAKKKIIIIANDWRSYQNHILKSKINSAFNELINISNKFGATIILFDQQPIFKPKSYYAYACTSEFYRPNKPKICNWNLEFENKEFLEGRRMVSNIQEYLNEPNLKIFSPHKTFCKIKDEKSIVILCNSQFKKIISIDGSHLTRDGSKSLAAPFITFIKSLEKIK